MDHDSLEIRPITESELEDVLDVYRRCEDFLALGPELRASAAMVLHDIETSRSEKGIFCGIYVPDKRLIGVVDYIPFNFNGVDSVAFISLVMIVASRRNRGIGTKILRLVESKIRSVGRAGEIRTAVQLNNPAALRFWQRNGYRIYGKPERRPDQTIVSYLRKELGGSD